MVVKLRSREEKVGLQGLGGEINQELLFNWYRAFNAKWKSSRELFSVHIVSNTVHLNI